MPIPKTQSGEMPFLDHLEELRWRIIWSLIALAIGVAVGFWIVTKFQIILLLERPITPFFARATGPSVRWTDKLCHRKLAPARGAEERECQSIFRES